MKPFFKMIPFVILITALIVGALVYAIQKKLEKDQHAAFESSQHVVK